MKKIWLKNYPEGVKAEYGPPPYSSIAEVIRNACKSYGSQSAYSGMGKTLTFAEVERLSDAMACYYQKDLGLKKGDRIALMLPNVLQYPVCLFGAIKAGLIVVNVNPLYTARELEHVLRDSEASAVVILANAGHSLEEAMKKVPVKHVIVTELGDLLGFPKKHLVNFAVKWIKRLVPSYSISQAVPFLTAVSRHSGSKPQHLEIGLDDIALLQYTGGTTGTPKGAMLTHGNICSNLQILREWFQTVQVEGNETAFTALPLYHIFSFTCNCLLYFMVGGCNVLIVNPRDLDATINEMKKWKFTYISAVNTLFNALLHHPEFSKLDFSQLRLTIGGGMAVQKSVADEWQKKTGSVLIQGYGLTETSPVVCVNPASDESFTGSIGMPIPSTELSIRDENGKELGIGEAGELCVRGPQVAKGYWKRPEESAKAFSEDGWFATGDIATVDAEGYAYIVDRKKDMILVSGFNVYPNEVEDVISHHPKVLELAAVGSPDPERGEVVKLFVVKKEDSLTKEELIAYARERLAPYKVPKIIEFRDELPKTNVGKILRRKLRDEAAATV